jgi:hypothetical protein
MAKTRRTQVVMGHRVEPTPAQLEADRTQEFEQLVALAAARAVAEAKAKPVADLQTIGASELGQLIGRSTMMVKVDACRRPLTLPPRFVVPGMRKMLWRVVDVREWMDALAEMEQERRAAQVKFAREHKLPEDTHLHFRMGDPKTAQAATERMLAKRRAPK